jgi:hypothetical protein
MKEKNQVSHPEIVFCHTGKILVYIIPLALLVKSENKHVFSEFYRFRKLFNYPYHV